MLIYPPKMVLGLVLSIASLSLVLASEETGCTADYQTVGVGAKGRWLRARVIANECDVIDERVSENCVQRLNISLARGEIYRNKDVGVDMRLYGSQLCTRHTNIKTATNGKIRRCLQGCYDNVRLTLPRLIKTSRCTKFEDDVELCSLTGTDEPKTFLSIKILPIQART